MPRAAVPDYLGKHFGPLLQEASPGMRFGMYLPIWTARRDQEQAVEKMASRRSPKAQDVSATLDAQGMDAAIDRFAKETLWEKNDSAARNAWDTITPLNASDRQRMTALAERQDALIAAVPEADRLTVDGVGIAPFVTGMGNEHPLENGFAFLDPHGLPYLPASGVKGVLRTAAEELASGEWGDTHGWDREFAVDVGDYETFSAIELLFGHDPEKGQRVGATLFRGLLQAWDVFPQVRGDRLMVEIMTPHQKDYYEGKASPHDSGQPNPISFLAVPAGSGFTFHLRIDRARLRVLGLERELGQQWQALAGAAFRHAFEWLGFGAKTSLGYGAMEPDQRAARAREEKARQRAEQDQAARRQRELENLSPEERARYEARETIQRFRAATETAREEGYTPGDTFDQQRNDFIQAADGWEDDGLRREAAEALDASFSNNWGASKKKRKTLKDAVRRLKGE